MVFLISFDLAIFDRENRIENEEQIIVFQYDGVTKGRMVEIQLVNEI